ncbi:uncharacterized protein LOC125090764 isoform X2 [Lutra lutra]|uniref:uncharacterized protein LOC125090764 isoform X2 n=1 Tax=Lutra lutra TaxID=9657 RepID=UPI001FD31F11|nr:uncharacterized protein LOC125090764 isoform X2 [Lutra lutra]
MAVVPTLVRSDSARGMFRHIPSFRYSGCRWGPGVCLCDRRLRPSWPFSRTLNFMGNSDSSARPDLQGHSRTSPGAGHSAGPRAVPCQVQQPASRCREVGAGRVPEPCVLHEAVDPRSSSWASAPKVASRAVPGHEGRAAESGELSRQNGKPTAIGEGAWADGAAGDEGRFQDTGREAQVRLRRPLSRSTWRFPVQLPSLASSDCCGPPARTLSPSLLLQQGSPVLTPVCAGRVPTARFPLVSAELRAACCYSAAGGEAIESGGLEIKNKTKKRIKKRMTRGKQK